MKVQTAVSVVKITRLVEDAVTEQEDLLAAEEPLEIRIEYGDKANRRQKNFAVTMRTPGHDFELATGFLFTEGIINAYSNITSIRYCIEAEQDNIVKVILDESLSIDLKNTERNFYTTSSCGVCGKTSIEAVKTVIPGKENISFSINKNILQGLTATLRASQNVFEHTGGLHASALYDENGNLILLREDVGRHNALDKLIGAAMGLNLLPLEKYVLLLSGRASFELMQKAAMAGFNIVAAIGAPSGLAVAMAKEVGITLIGFLRENRFNIYSMPHRILLDK